MKICKTNLIIQLSFILIITCIIEAIQIVRNISYNHQISNAALHPITIDPIEKTADTMETGIGIPK